MIPSVGISKKHLVLDMLDGTNTVAAMAYRMVCVYDVSSEQATKDIEATILGLAELGMVVLACD